MKRKDVGEGDDDDGEATEDVVVEGKDDDEDDADEVEADVVDAEEEEDDDAVLEEEERDELSSGGGGESQDVATGSESLVPASTGAPVGDLKGAGRSFSLPSSHPPAVPNEPTASELAAQRTLSINEQMWDRLSRQTVVEEALRAEISAKEIVLKDLTTANNNLGAGALATRAEICVRESMERIAAEL